MVRESVNPEDEPEGLVWQQLGGPPDDTSDTSEGGSRSKTFDNDAWRDNVFADPKAQKRTARTMLRRCNIPEKRTAEGSHTITFKNTITRVTEKDDGCDARPTVLAKDGEFPIFSIFTKYYMDFKAIKTMDLDNEVALWRAYPVRWKDTWTPPQDERLETLHKGTSREFIVVDQFTAHICGFSDATWMLVMPDTYKPEFDMASGLLDSLTFTITTKYMDDDTYAGFRSALRTYITNGLTASVSAADRRREVYDEAKNKLLDFTRDEIVRRFTDAVEKRRLLEKRKAEERAQEEQLMLAKDVDDATKHVETCTIEEIPIHSPVNQRHVHPLRGVDTADLIIDDEMAYIDPEILPMLDAARNADSDTDSDDVHSWAKDADRATARDLGYGTDDESGTEGGSCCITESTSSTFHNDNAVADIMKVD